MTKAEQDSLILDALELAVKTARAFYPDSKQFSMSWIQREDGDYLSINNLFYCFNDNTKKLNVRRIHGEELNDFI